FIGSASTFDDNSPEPGEPICSWNELGGLEGAPIFLASPGGSHRAFSELSSDLIEQELRASKDALQQSLAKTIERFWYPYKDPGRDRNFTSDAVRRSGYRAVFYFLGGDVQLPVENAFHLTRVPVWPDSDLKTL